ncbi:MAG: hypothetical protein ACI4RM_00920 [Ruminococcus sp.]
MLKLVKRYAVYAIIIAMIYFIMPFFFQGGNQKFDAIEYQFVFPATALISGLVFSWRKGLDFTFPLIAPIIYMASAIAHSHEYHLVIYVFIYLILSMLGCFIGDMVYRNNGQGCNKNDKNNNDNEYNIKISNITVEKEEKHKDKSE